MTATITLAYDRFGINHDPESEVIEILRSSYDYQNSNMDYDNVRYHEGTTEHTFSFHLEECDQPKRTLETIRQIEDLLMRYI